MNKKCPFCDLPDDRVLQSYTHVVVIRDAFPISPGHKLVIPKRHISSLFDLSQSEISELFQALREARNGLASSVQVDGFNIGINDGVAAGQTVPHLHIHLIPRYEGDCADPRGGIRWIFPEKAKYWTD